MLGKSSFIEIPIATNLDGFSTSDSFGFIKGYEKRYSEYAWKITI